MPIVCSGLSPSSPSAIWSPRACHCAFPSDRLRPASENATFPSIQNGCSSRTGCPLNKPPTCTSMLVLRSSTSSSSRLLNTTRCATRLTASIRPRSKPSPDPCSCSSKPSTTSHCWRIQKRRPLASNCSTAPEPVFAFGSAMPDLCHSNWLVDVRQVPAPIQLGDALS